MKFILFSIGLLLCSLNVQACTIFKKTVNGKTLVGNNEDSPTPDYYLRTQQPGKNKFGVIYYGTKGWNYLPQGAINDQGLVFDWLQVPMHKILKNGSKISVEDWAKHMLEKIMPECATVSQVKTILSAYDLSFLQWSQLVFIDKSGNSIIVEGDTILDNYSSNKVCTNFLQSGITFKEEITCSRYLTADRFLSSHKELSVDLFRLILDSTKQTGVWGGTQVSQVYDLDRGLIHLFLFHNFNEDVILSVDSLTKRNDTLKLSGLFRQKSEFDHFEYNYTIARAAALRLGSCKDLQAMNIEFEIMRNNTQSIIFRDELFSSAHQQLDLGHHEFAFGIIDFCFEVMHNKSKLYAEKAKMYVQIGDYTQALTGINKALEQDALNSEYLQLKADVLTLLGKK